MAGRSWGLRLEDYEELERRVTAEVDAWDQRHQARGREPMTPAERERAAETFRPGILRSLKCELKQDRQRVPCGAYARSTGQPCRALSVPGKRRCRLHGGLSTGPKTAEGKARCADARWPARRLDGGACKFPKDHL